ncbi:MAG: phosphoribosylamine--glycine ligase [Phycisphaeraceae bacterium]|nr:phosphoribosylamine--glycine ligase [Phycisphaeraceae bacterium]
MLHSPGSQEPAARTNVLLVGGGGREHALAAALVRSRGMGDLWLATPGNAGLASLGRGIDFVPSRREIYRLVQFCDHKRIGLVVIGPEDPLAEGWADALRAPHRRVFGPGADGARLEADKAWAKQLMRGAAIPTAEGRAFSDPEAAIAFLESRDEPQVIKAAGLAKGKGVVVPETLEEARAAIDRIMRQRIFGDAGRTVVIEERLKGREVSVLALVDGRSIHVLPPCQDHKRLRDGDAGPNTGGMGAFCPAEGIDDELMARVERQILVPTLDALRREGIDFCGVLYAGLMLTPGGPKVLEFNTRFGDPECQPLMSRFRGDLLQTLIAACDRRLDEMDLEWDPRPAVCVVLASEGYPESPRTGVPIEGLEEAGEVEGVTVYHAGTKIGERGRVVTAGGRVLGVTALGETMAEARERAYAACGRIRFEGMVYRRDIAMCPTPVERHTSPA